MLLLAGLIITQENDGLSKLQILRMSARAHEREVAVDPWSCKNTIMFTRHCSMSELLELMNLDNMQSGKMMSHKSKTGLDS